MNKDRHLKLVWSQETAVVKLFPPPPPRKGPDKCYVCGNEKFQRRVTAHVCTKCGENYKL